jgi:DUF971 family protein
MTTPVPTGLALESDDLLCIRWSDGSERRYAVRQLRDRCPCATCREKRQAVPLPGMLTVLRPEETRPLRIIGMKPVGNYAYGIEFSDGHDTGIFTIESLWRWEAP